MELSISEDKMSKRKQEKLLGVHFPIGSSEQAVCTVCYDDHIDVLQRCITIQGVDDDRSRNAVSIDLFSPFYHTWFNDYLDQNPFDGVLTDYMNGYDCDIEQAYLRVKDQSEQHLLCAVDFNDDACIEQATAPITVESIYQSYIDLEPSSVFSPNELSSKSNELSSIRMEISKLKTSIDKIHK